jgi:hypothetical protein
VAAGRDLAQGVDAPPPPRPRTRVSNGAPPPPPVTLPLTGLRGAPVRVPVCMAFGEVADGTDGTEEDTVPAPTWLIPPIAIMATPAAVAMTMASVFGMDVSPGVGCTHGLPGATRQKEKRRRAAKACGSR